MTRCQLVRPATPELLSGHVAPVPARRPHRDARARPACQRLRSPASQIKDAAGNKDGQKPLDRWRDRFGLEMHNDGLAEDVGKAAFCNAIEARKDGRAKMDLRMPPPRLGQESF